MREKRRTRSLPKNLDSLVDIVSNNLGILIILAAFMALFGLVNPLNVTEQESRKAQVLPPPKLLVPWSHASNKNPVLFVMRGNRILHLDMAKFFKQLAEQPEQSRPRPVTLQQKQLKIRFFPVTNQVYCLEFTPDRNAGETWHTARRGASAWQRVAKRYRPESFYYFFWVSGDSFELFRDVRKQLWTDQYEVGWKPVTKDEPLEICSGFEGSTGFQPQ